MDTTSATPEQPIEPEETSSSSPVNNRPGGAKLPGLIMAVFIVLATPDDIRLGPTLAALPKVDLQDKSGEIKFDNYGDLAGGGYDVYTIKNEQFVLTRQG